MKKILLVSNRVMHYRARIYNVFYDKWKEAGYEFHVVSDEYQKVDFDIRYIKHELPFGSVRYAKFINKLKPDVVINFLHLKDKMIIPLTYYCKWKNIPMIYWNHGINLHAPNSKWKNAIFHFIHTISDAIILYTPDQLKYIAQKNLKKTFIAYNTLSLENSDAFRKCIPSKEAIKSEYGIKEKFVLLYISRILPYKGVDLLIDNFKNVKDLALVVVGGGINNQQLEVINDTQNYYYLGEKYGDKVDAIYSIGDFFSTPGHIGLAVNQAFYWGLPVFVLNRIQAPEIYYLKNGENGYIMDSMDEIKLKIIELTENPKEHERLRDNARKTFEEKMSINNMFDGFAKAIKYTHSPNTIFRVNRTS